MEILLRYLHFISILLIFGTLMAEHLLVKKELTRADIALLVRIDSLYGLAALLLLMVLPLLAGLMARGIGYRGH